MLSPHRKKIPVRGEEGVPDPPGNTLPRQMLPDPLSTSVCGFLFLFALFKKQGIFESNLIFGWMFYLSLCGSPRKLDNLTRCKTVLN